MKLVKASAVIFHRNYKLLKTNFIPSELVMLSLSKKLDKDMEQVGPLRYEIEEDIGQLTRDIHKTNKEISNALNYLNHRQKSISQFLVKYNNQLDKRSNSVFSNV